MKPPRTLAQLLAAFRGQNSSPKAASPNPTVPNVTVTPTQGAGLNVFGQAAAFLEGNLAAVRGAAGSPAANGRDSTIAALQRQLGERDATIAALERELGELRAGRQLLEQALASGFQSPQANLNPKETVLAEFRAETDPARRAHLAAKFRSLPSNGTADASAQRIETLQAQFRAETDPVKRAHLSHEILSALRQQRKAA